MTMSAVGVDSGPITARAGECGGRTIIFGGRQPAEVRVAVRRFAEAEPHVRDWAQAEATRERNLQALRVRIPALQERLLMLEARQPCLDASVERAEVDPLQTEYLSRLRWVRRNCCRQLQRVRRQLGLLHELERLLTEDLQRLIQARQEEANRTASPAMDVWRFLVDTTPYQTLNTHTQLALAQELIDAGLLEDPSVELVSEIGHYLSDSIAARAARDFFFKRVTGFVRAHLATLSRKAADVRTFASRWALKLTTETGSAAAIARRLNPLGAPPQLV